MSDKITQQVHRKSRTFSGALKKIMIVLAVLFVGAGIVISQGFMLPGFLLVLLYFLYDTFSRRDYEYTLEDGVFSVETITGKRYRRLSHAFPLSQVEVLSPHDHEAVARYRQDAGGQKLPKYDYTSYDEDTPYYTLIAVEDRVKIKLLLDLNGEMLTAFAAGCPGKVFGL